MLLGWFKKRRRRRILAKPLPQSWRTIIEQNVTLYHRLTEAEKTKLESDLRIFIAEKNFTGCGGFEVTDEVRVTIAAQACVLILNLDQDIYPAVREILIYPSSYTAPQQQGYIVSESHRLGEAHYRGPIVLAWDAVRHGGIDTRDGRNLVYHEFAHKLDFRDGTADGTPIFDRPADFEQWIAVMTAHYEQLCDAAERRRATLLDKYGCTNPAEFFAVATECFFEKHDQLKRKHPDLYEVLSIFYKQDPAD